jgi:hypothetical protein
MPQPMMPVKFVAQAPARFCIAHCKGPHIAVQELVPAKSGEMPPPPYGIVHCKRAHAAGVVGGERISGAAGVLRRSQGGQCTGSGGAA